MNLVRNFIFRKSVLLFLKRTENEWREVVAHGQVNSDAPTVSKIKARTCRQAAVKQLLSVASLFSICISIGVFIQRAVQPLGPKQATAVEMPLLNKLATALQRFVCVHP